MDLRKFKMPGNIDELVIDKGAKKSEWYQPFIFRDDLITGSCGPWALNAPSNVCTAKEPKKLQKEFLQEALKLGNFYDKLNQIALEAVPTSQQFLEIACNAGHFCFDLARQGKEVTGVDVWTSSYEIVKKITNIEFEYLAAVYHKKLHRVPELGARLFDFVITINFANHLIDIPFFIDYVGTKAKKGFLFGCLVDYSETPFLKLRTRAGMKDNQLLHRFEYMPSSSAIELMLYSLNFKYVYHYRFNANEDPEYCKRWGIWLVTHDPVNEEVLSKYGVERVRNKIEYYAEDYSGVLSQKKF